MNLWQPRKTEQGVHRFGSEAAPKHTTGAMARLKYFEGMKMMNGMMNMDGTMNDMGMNMSLQQMDMNTVMYPELWTAMKQERR